MKRLLSSFVVAVVTLFLSVIPMSSESARADTVCNSIFQFEDPSSCVISDSEGAYLGTPSIQSCNDTFAGIVLSTGYDSVGYVVLKGVGTDGVLQPGSTINYSIWMSQDCRAWSNAYGVSIRLVSDSGDVLQGVQSGASFQYSQKFTGAIGSYCYTNICGASTFTGTISVPSGSSTGQYRVLLAVDFNAKTAIVPLPALHQDLTLKTRLSKLTSFPSVGTLYFPNGGVLSCLFLDFKPADVQKFGITGTDWSISVDGLEMASYQNLPLYSGARFEKIVTSGEFVVDQNSAAGVPVYSFGVRAQKKGHTYSCSVAVRTSAGVGTPMVVTATPLYDSQNWTVIQPPSTTTITCVKGKLTKRVTAVNPKCPTGYKKKG